MMDLTDDYGGGDRDGGGHMMSVVFDSVIGRVDCEQLREPLSS